MLVSVGCMRLKVAYCGCNWKSASFSLCGSACAWSGLGSAFFAVFCSICADFCVSLLWVFGVDPMSIGAQIVRDKMTASTIIECCQTFLWRAWFLTLFTSFVLYLISPVPPGGIVLATKLAIRFKFFWAIIILFTFAVLANRVRTIASNLIKSGYQKSNISNKVCQSENWLKLPTELYCPVCSSPAF